MLGLALAPVLAAAVLAGEVQLARRGPDLPDDTPLVHDGRLGPVATATAPPLRMVWLGDSTAAGVGASDADHAIPRRVAEALERSVELTSLAISGDRVADVVADQIDQLDGLHPDVVLVSIGANDVVHLSSRADFRRGYDALVAAVPAGAMLVILGVPDMGAPDRYLQPLRSIAALRGRQLDEVSRAVARDHEAVYVDIAGETGPRMRADRSRYFAADRYHPSDDGYALWASAVLEELVPALAAREVDHADR
ncbi:MAG: SGNH/GDSL hydrolase family protein [Acidimicrobiales bacterium]